MRLGFIGLGKMGGAMVERLLKGGHEVVAHARSADSVRKVEVFGARGAHDLAALAEIRHRRGFARATLDVNEHVLSAQAHSVRDGERLAEREGALLEAQAHGAPAGNGWHSGQ